jgi:hypothetical protein
MNQKTIEFGDIRSAIQRCVEDPERLDAAVHLLLRARAQGDGALWRAAEPYARGALSRVPVGRADAWEVASWCLSGVPVLKAHLSRFSPVVGLGVERWAAVFAWCTVVSQRHGLTFGDVQATSSYATADGITHQLIMMTHHDGMTYLLDVQQGPGDLCLGIVGGRGRQGEYVNVKWGGELAA